MEGRTVYFWVLASRFEWKSPVRMRGALPSSAIRRTVCESTYKVQNIIVSSCDCLGCFILGNISLGHAAISKVYLTGAVTRHIAIALALSFTLLATGKGHPQFADGWRSAPQRRH